MTLLETGTPKYAPFVVISQHQSVLFAENVQYVQHIVVESLIELSICWVSSISIEQKCGNSSSIENAREAFAQ